MFTVTDVDRRRQQFEWRVTKFLVEAAVLFAIMWGGALLVARLRYTHDGLVDPVLVTPLALNDALGGFGVVGALLIALHFLAHQSADGPRDYARLNVLVGATRLAGGVGVWLALAAVIGTPRELLRWVVMFSFSFVIAVFVVDAEDRLDAKIEAKLRVRSIKRDMARLRFAQRWWGPPSGYGVSGLIVRSVAEATVVIALAAMPAIVLMWPGAGVWSMLIAVVGITTAYSLVVVAAMIAAVYAGLTKRRVRCVAGAAVVAIYVLGLLAGGAASAMSRGDVWLTTAVLWLTVVPVGWAVLSCRRRGRPSSAKGWVHWWLNVRIGSLQRKSASLQANPADVSAQKIFGLVSGP
jgi:hypothetical protein